MKYINMLLLSFIALGLYAQQGEPQKFSLKEAIEYAKKNNYLQKNATLDIAAAHAKVNETRAMGLPQVKAEGRFTYTPQIPIMVLPNTNGAFGPEPVIRFPQGIDYMASGSINATQLLFDGGYIIGLKASQTYEELSKQDAQKTEHEIILDVTRAYCNVLLTAEMLKMIDVSLASLEATKTTIGASYAAGFVEKTEADRINIIYSNTVIERKKVLDALQTVKQGLNFVMGMKVSDQITLSDSLVHLYTSAQAQQTVVPEKIDYMNRPDYRVIDVQARLTVLDRKRYQYSYTPTLAAFLTHQQNAFSVEFNPLFRNFYPGTFMGLNISLPIFDGFDKRSKIQQAKINTSKLETARVMKENVIETEVFTSKAKYNRAKETIDQQVQNKELAQEVYKRINIKYQNGLSSSLDVVAADRDLKEAQQNYIQAIYELIVAKAELEKALGNK